MNLLAWNCRGLGNRRAVDKLRDLIQAKDLGIVFFIGNLVDIKIDGGSSR